MRFEDWVIIGVPVFAFGPLITIYFLAKREDRQRSVRLQAISDKHHFRYTDKLDDVDAMFECIAMTLGGVFRYSKHVLEGHVADIHIKVMDCHYSESDAFNAPQHVRTLFACHVPQAHLPDFDLDIKGVLSKVHGKHDECEFEYDNATGFSRKYNLRVRDQSEANLYFTSARLKQIDAALTERNWRVQSFNSWVAIVQNGKRVYTKDWEKFFFDSLAFVNSLNNELLDGRLTRELSARGY